MLPVRTVFILGAGAGVDIGMPIGSNLSAEIAQRLSIKFGESDQETGDKVIADALRKVARERGEEKWSDWRMAGAGVARGIGYTRSIDAYINMHKDNDKIALCAKLAIVRSILHCEYKSAIHLPNKLLDQFRDESRAQKSWFNDLVYVLQNGISAGVNLKEIFSNCTFINFNYDRCLEFFLLKALQDLTQRPKEEIEQLILRAPIFHPYGAVGSIFHQEGKRFVEFGDHTYADVLGLSSEIKTFNEELDDTLQLQIIKQRVTEAQQIIFLGFHFHDQNMALMESYPPKRSADVRIYGTAIGRSSAEIHVIDKQIREMLGPRGGRLNINIVNRLGCKELFGEFSTTFLQR